MVLDPGEWWPSVLSHADIPRPWHTAKPNWWRAQLCIQGTLYNSPSHAALENKTMLKKKLCSHVFTCGLNNFSIYAFWLITETILAVEYYIRRIIKPKVCWGLDNSSYHAKTKFNSCFIIYLKYSKDPNTIRTSVLNSVHINTYSNKYAKSKPVCLTLIYKCIHPSVNNILINIFCPWNEHDSLFSVPLFTSNFDNNSTANPYILRSPVSIQFHLIGWLFCNFICVHDVCTGCNLV